jgi:DNA repair protein RecO (recombination protein O)
MATYRTEAFVIRKWDFREYDQLVTVFTKEKGKVDLIVKGSRKISSKMAGHLEPFGVVDIMVAQGKAYDRIAGTKLLENYPNLKLNLEGVALSVYFNETVNSIIHGNQTDHKVFPLIQDYYRSIDSYVSQKGDGGDIHNQVLIALSYILRLLDSQGFAPVFNICFYCKNSIIEEKNYVSDRHLSVICPSCRQKEDMLYPVSTTALKVLRLINQKSFSTIKLTNFEPTAFTEVRKVINNFTQSISERQMRSYTFLSTLIVNS